METFYRKLPDGTFEIAGTYYDSHDLLKANHGVIIVKDNNQTSYKFFAPDMSPAAAFLKALILAFEVDFSKEVGKANKWNIDTRKELTAAEKKALAQFNKVFTEPHPHLVGAALADIIRKSLEAFSKKYIKEKDMERFL